MDTDPDDPAAAAAIVEERISVPASGRSADEVHAALARFFAGIERSAPRGIDGAWRAAFVTAVGEIIGNIARHAHPPSTHETLDVRLRLFPGHVEARFLDTGIPFVPRPHAEPDAEPGIDALTEGGRGLALIRAAVDELHYDRLDGGVNRWLLIKHIR